MTARSRPRQLWVTRSRARNRKGTRETWYLVSNLSWRAEHAAKESGHRFGGAVGFREAQWYLGFTQARVNDMAAWWRLLALLAMALRGLTTLGLTLLIPGGEHARNLWRRLASRRRDRCELSLVSAMIYLLQQDRSLFIALSPRTNLNLEASLSNLS